MKKGLRQIKHSTTDHCYASPTIDLMKKGLRRNVKEDLMALICPTIDLMKKGFSLEEFSGGNPRRLLDITRIYGLYTQMDRKNATPLVPYHSASCSR